MIGYVFNSFSYTKYSLKNILLVNNILIICIISIDDLHSF